MEKIDYFKNTKASLDRISDVYNALYEGADEKDFELIDMIACDNPELLIAGSLMQDWSSSFCRKLGNILLQISEGHDE